jgi:predicted ATPase
MKVSKIELADFLHFKKKITIDLTYPEGHPKAGDPLDKVCFLGQSGTGKSTLLNLVKYFSCGDAEYDKSSIPLDKLQKGTATMYFTAGNQYFSKVTSSKTYQFDYWDHARAPKKKISDIEVFLKKEVEPQLKNRSHHLLNFPFCVVGPYDVPSENLLIQEKGIAKFNLPKGELHEIQNKVIWDFNSSNIKAIWNVVFNKVSEYIKEYNAREIELSRKIRDKTKDADKLVTEFKTYEEKTPNPIEELAEKFLNPILSQFNLEVETDIKKYPLEESNKENYIIIKSKHDGKTIAYPFLSTGTKQIMLTAIPLYFLNPQKSIILFDQPETSLYPNIQLKLVDIYTSIASKTNQFFYATHSPLVASSFDPWEVVELRFDETTGVVYRKEYYEGKREKKF